MNADEETSATENLVLELRRRHNALIPAVNAPTDILYIIFSQYPAKIERKARIEHPPTWLAIMMVCSRWRQIYITNPTLWNAPGRIDLSDMVDIADVFIERAMGVSKDLWFHFADPENDGAQVPKSLSADILWLKSLKITGIGHKLAKALRVLEGQPAPRLEALNIELELDELTTEGHDFSQSKLFAGSVPLLTALTLKNCLFSFDSALLNAATLTRLDLKGHSSLQRPSLDDLATLFQRLSALRFIRFQDCLPDIAYRRMPPQSRVELPHLHHFELISDSPFALCAVAQCVRVPVTAKYLICCLNHSLANIEDLLGMQHVEPLATAMLTHIFMYGPQGPPRDDICFDQHLLALSSDDMVDPYESSVELGTMQYGELEDLDAPFDFMRQTQSWVPLVGLRISWQSGFEPGTPHDARACFSSFVYASLLRFMPLAALKGAHISGDVFRQRVMFNMAFQNAKNVEALTLSGQAQLGALEAMSSLIDSAQLPSSEPLFPSLKRLCFCDVPSESVLADENTAFTHLRATLQRRRDAGHDAIDGLRVLGRLGLYRSVIPAAQIEELGPLVAHGSIDVREEAEVDEQ